MNHCFPTQGFSVISEPLDRENYDNELTFSPLKPVTKIINKDVLMKRSYVYVPTELRTQLIEAVHNNGEKIKYAAKRLGINYSSAKSICQIYKHEGRSDRKASRWTSLREKKAIKTQFDPVVMNFETKLSQTEFTNKEKAERKRNEIYRAVPMEKSFLMDQKSCFEESPPKGNEEKKWAEESSATCEIKAISTYSSFLESEPLKSEIAQQIKQSHYIHSRAFQDAAIKDIVPNLQQASKFSPTLTLANKTLPSFYSPESQNQVCLGNPLSILASTLNPESSYPAIFPEMSTPYNNLLGLNFAWGLKQSFHPQVYPIDYQDFYRPGNELSQYSNRLFSIPCLPLENLDSLLKSFPDSTLNSMPIDQITAYYIQNSRKNG